MERDGGKFAVTREITQVKIIRPDDDDVIQVVISDDDDDDGGDDDDDVDDDDDMFTPKSLSVYNLSNTVHTAQPQ